MQPRQRQPDSSPRRKPWVSKHEARGSPGRGVRTAASVQRDPRVTPSPTTVCARTIAACQFHPSIAPPGAFALFRPVTHGLRRGLGSDTAAAVKKRARHRITALLRSFDIALAVTQACGLGFRRVGPTGLQKTVSNTWVNRASEKNLDNRARQGSNRWGICCRHPPYGADTP